MIRRPSDCAVLEAILQFNQDRKRKLVQLKLRHMLEIYADVVSQVGSRAAN